MGATAPPTPPVPSTRMRMAAKSIGGAAGGGVGVGRCRPPGLKPGESRRQTTPLHLRPPPLGLRGAERLAGLAATRLELLVPLPRSIGRRGRGPLPALGLGELLPQSRHLLLALSFAIAGVLVPAGARRRPLRPSPALEHPQPGLAERDGRLQRLRQASGTEQLARLLV